MHVQYEVTWTIILQRDREDLARSVSEHLKGISSYIEVFASGIDEALKHSKDSGKFKGIAMHTSQRQPFKPRDALSTQTYPPPIHAQVHLE